MAGSFFPKEKSPLARAPFPIVDFLMEGYDTNRRFLEGDAAAAQQLCEVAGKDNGGDGNRYEAADNHGREHLAQPLKWANHRNQCGRAARIFGRPFFAICFQIRKICEKRKNLLTSGFKLVTI